MQGPRIPHEKELPQIYEFLNTNLRPGVNWSIVSEYPTALGANNIGNIRVISEQGKVISHAVLKPLVIKTPLVIFKVGAIGSVVTDSNHRNQGLSTKILEECISESKKQNCDIALLWTNLYDFYRKMDFELAGHEESIVINNEFDSPPMSLKFLKTTQISPESILRLYSQHTVGTVRTAEEIRKFLAIPQTVVYSAWDNSGQLAAFAVEGKGADLSGYIHEWGGSVPALLSLFSHIRKEKKQSYTIILPHHSLNLLSALKRIQGITHNEGYLGMIKIVNHQQLFQKVKKASRTLGVNDLVLENCEGGILFGLGNDTIKIEDNKDLIKIFFGPLPEISSFKPETQRVMERIFPLNLWVWGWDSI